jgi:hypothetical protein
LHAVSASLDAHAKCLLEGGYFLRISGRCLLLRLSLCLLVVLLGLRLTLAHGTSTPHGAQRGTDGRAFARISGYGSNDGPPAAPRLL